MAENDLRKEIIERLDSGKPASGADILRLLRENEDLEAENARLRKELRLKDIALEDINTRCHEAENEIIGLQDALIIAKEERRAALNRIAELEEVLVSLLDSARNQEAFDGNMVAVLLNGPIVSRDAIEGARAALGEKAAPADTVCVPRSILEPFVLVAAALERYEKMAGRKLPNSAPVCGPLEELPKPRTYISLGEVRALARIANGAKAAPEESHKDMAKRVFRDDPISLGTVLEAIGEEDDGAGRR